ncbi:MAG: hypothetical protein IPG82_11015 [Saprospiraceae bacterium]|nr:hypothetical protein [Saprospiraceae bacterium]
MSDNCLVSVVIPLSATDNCAAASDIRFRYFIDLNATDAVYNGRLFDPTSIDQGGTVCQRLRLFIRRSWQTLWCM